MHNLMKKIIITFLITMAISCFYVPVKNEVFAKTYYTTKKANVPHDKSGTCKFYKIFSIKGNKVTYAVLNRKWTEDGYYYKCGKKKTAKLTKKTKYYIGVTKRFNFSKGGGWYSNKSKWIYKSNLSTFKKNLLPSDSSIRVKSGKVKQIYTRICLAD